jgi:hypothetical protein
MNDRSRPEAASEAAAKQSPVTPDPAPDRPRRSFELRRARERRRVSRQLDRLLGCRYPYPDPHQVYGTTPALARALEAEAVA